MLFIEFCFVIVFNVELISALNILQCLGKFSLQSIGRLFLIGFFRTIFYIRSSYLSDRLTVNESMVLLYFLVLKIQISTNFNVDSHEEDNQRRRTIFIGRYISEHCQV